MPGGREKRAIIRPSQGGGGAEGNRTPDLLIANEALSQLSYSPALPDAAAGQTPRGERRARGGRTMARGLGEVKAEGPGSAPVRPAAPRGCLRLTGSLGSAGRPAIVSPGDRREMVLT